MQEYKKLYDKRILRINKEVLTNSELPKAVILMYTKIEKRLDERINAAYLDAENELWRVEELLNMKGGI